MPRTTLDLDATVLHALRRRGQREHKSIGRLASELLAQALDRPAEDASEPFRWTSSELGRPLVDLEDKDAVARRLDAG